jgi:Ribbon-helix-helix protein, copG family
MVRTQIQLTERQSKRLKALAKRRGVSVAEIIRRAVDQASEASLLADQEEVRARTLEVIGKYTDSATDVSEDVDRYLAETLAP